VLNLKNNFISLKTNNIAAYLDANANRSCPNHVRLINYKYYGTAI
jgi:hypothetical protein